MDLILVSSSVKPEWLRWWFCKHGERHVREKSPTYFTSAAQSMFLSEENQFSRSLGEWGGREVGCAWGKEVNHPQSYTGMCLIFFYVARA